jgi:hypothetical protein
MKDKRKTKEDNNLNHELTLGFNIDLNEINSGMLLDDEGSKLRSFTIGELTNILNKPNRSRCQE